MSRVWPVLVVALLMVACGDDDDGTGDAATDTVDVTTDTGMLPADTGTDDTGADIDTGTDVDTGTGDDTGTPPADTGTDTTPPDTSEPDTGEPPTGEWMTLVEGDWRLSGGEEAYYCARATVRETLWISGFEAIAPEGTHHTVLTVGSPDRPDGMERCGVGTNRDEMIYGSGVGTTPLDMPRGVAVRIPAGQQVLVNLHLYNTRRSDLRGTSGVRVRTVPERSVENEAEAVLMGTEAIFIPGRARNHVINGYCEMEGDATIFAIMPHMHMFGVRMRVEHGGEVLYDRPYTFDDQQFRDVSPMRNARRGQRVNVRCTYDNPTASTVTFGESSDDEMCYAVTYRYPPVGGLRCTSFGF